MGGVLLSPLFCKPWDTAQRPRGVRAPQLEALCPHGWVLARSGRLRAGRDAGELSGSCAGCGCSPGTRRIPPPRGWLWNWIRILFKWSFFTELEG